MKEPDYFLDTTVDAVREFLSKPDSEFNEVLTNCLDEAQGRVYTVLEFEKVPVYILIRIAP